MSFDLMDIQEVFNKSRSSTSKFRNSNNMQSLHFQAYYRQGVALQCLAKHGEAIAAFANGLAQDPKSPQLLEGLVEATLKSPLKG